jgi:hypothetical protein
MDFLMCKGDWTLGTACGRCSKCIESAKPMIDRLLAHVTALENRLQNIAACLPSSSRSYDFSDRYKLECFEEARRLATKPSLPASD